MHQVLLTIANVPCPHLPVAFPQDELAILGLLLWVVDGLFKVDVVVGVGDDLGSRNNHGLIPLVRLVDLYLRIDYALLVLGDDFMASNRGVSHLLLALSIPTHVSDTRSSTGDWHKIRDQDLLLLARCRLHELASWLILIGGCL